MAQVSFNFYEDDRRISTRLSGEQAHVCSEQIDRFIEFLRAQGFAELSIFGYFDQRVAEFDHDNPGRLNEYNPIF
jgi:hypothetical protein